MIEPVSNSTGLTSSTQSVMLDQIIGDYPTNASNKIEEAFASVSAANDSMGAEFIQKLSSYSNSIIEAKQDMADKVSAAGADISPTELLSYQMDIYKITLQVDLASKCVSKNNQNADTLLKAQ
jgi:type III secretion system YscI/HrpB-like protein